MRSKLEVSEGWDEIWSKQQLHNLIPAVRGIYVGHADANQGMYNLAQSVKNFYSFYQKDKTTVEDYEQDFKSYYETSIAYGAAPPISKGLVKECTTMLASDQANPTVNETKKATTDVTETFLGCMFVSSANQKKFGGLKKDLHNNFLMGRDTYHKTMEEAERLLAGYKPVWTVIRQCQ